MLLEVDAFERISICGITAAADVGYRPCFRHYPRHYPGKDALFEEIARRPAWIPSR